MGAPPVLLIPGNMCDARLWAPVAKHLARAGHVVLDAPRLDSDSIEGMAELVLAEIETPVVVLGFSMGAIVATEMARQATQRIAALGLVAFNASADLPERAAVRPKQQAGVRAGKLVSIIVDELKPNYLADVNRSDVALLSLVMEMAVDAGPQAFIAQSEALRLRPDLRPTLAGLAMPVLLACGREDRLCPPAWHHRWAQMIGDNAQVAEIRDAGHLVPLERPDELAQAIIAWLAKEFACPMPS